MKILMAAINFFLVDVENGTKKIATLGEEIEKETSAPDVIIMALEFVFVLARYFPSWAIANVLIEVADFAGKIFYSSTGKNKPLDSSHR